MTFLTSFQNDAQSGWYFSQQAHPRLFQITSCICSSTVSSIFSIRFGARFFPTRIIQSWSLALGMLYVFHLLLLGPVTFTSSTTGCNFSKDSSSLKKVLFLSWANDIGPKFSSGMTGLPELGVCQGSPDGAEKAEMESLVGEFNSFVFSYNESFRLVAASFDSSEAEDSDPEPTLSLADQLINTCGEASSSLPSTDCLSDILEINLFDYSNLI